MRITSTAAILLSLLITSTPLMAENPTPYSGMQIVSTGKPFMAYHDKLLEVIKANKMGVVAHACADCGAKKVLDQTIAKNRVIMVFHPRFAVRMLEASVASGIEAPLRLYLTEEPDGSAKLTYRLPSHVFGAYEVEALDEMAGELDAIIAKIVDEAGA